MSSVLYIKISYGWTKSKLILVTDQRRNFEVIMTQGSVTEEV